MDNVSLTSMFLRGGLIMWPLLVLSVLSALIIVERAIFFFLRRYRVGKALDKAKSTIDGGTLGASKNPLIQVASVYLGGLDQGREHVENITGREASRLLNRHERGLRFLATIGNIAPLIGLLGTVWGMVQAFANIAALGDNVSPSDLADGIWTGLLTTVAGLVVAIPAITMARFFEARIDHLAHDLNETVSHLDEWTKDRD